MSRVFISYRHTPPDEALAGELEAFLSREGLEVFLDRRMLVGTDWVAEIDRRLRAATDFVVLLSADSILSDMLRQEVKLAHQLSRDGGLKILPIRIGFDGGLPYDLGAYLNRLQYAPWKPGQDVEPLCHQLLAAIRRTAA
ncbi:MAG: toll/interleukin-1 receptor domain-containing protein, partial [Acidobacteriota bacterium]|nr:toll/interleukin-1 receptor domain-containing protein [Acidobacteriota bacterium]